MNFAYQYWHRLIIFLGLNPLFSISTINIFVPLMLLSFQLKKISEVHIVFWLISFVVCISFIKGFLFNINNLQFDQLRHVLSLIAYMIPVAFLIFKLPFSLDVFLKILVGTSCLYGIYVLSYFYINGLSILDIGGTKAIEIPAFPQRFPPLMVLPLLYCLSKVTKNKIFALPILILFFTIFLTFTRSLYIFLIISCFIFLAIRFYQYPIITRLKIALVSIVLFLLSSLTLAYYQEQAFLIVFEQLINSTINSIIEFISGETNYTNIYSALNSENQRIYFWSLGMDLFYKNPLLGTGLAGLYHFGFPEIGSVHSQWVDQLMRIGILGTLIYIYCNLKIIKFFFWTHPYVSSWIIGLMVFGFLNESTKEMYTGIVFYILLNFALYKNPVSKK